MFWLSFDQHFSTEDEKACSNTQLDLSIFLDGCQAQEMTTTDKVKEMMLAPGTELEPNEVVGVLNFMFGWKAIDMAGIYRTLEGLKTPLEEILSEEGTTPPELISYASLFKCQLEGTLHMGPRRQVGMHNCQTICFASETRCKHCIK